MLNVNMPVTTRSADQQDILPSASSEDIIETEPKSNSLDACVTSSVGNNSKDECWDGCCDCCAHYKSEVEKLKGEIIEIKKYLKIPAANRPNGSKEDMQIIGNLEKNNAALISAVEALSKQVLHSVSTNPSELPDVQIENSNENSKDVQIENSNNTNGQPSSKRKRKRRKRKNSNPSNHANHEIDKSTSPNVPNVDETGSAQDATPTRHVKETVVIAGDSIVKNIIGAKMGAGDSTHHFVVKPFEKIDA